ncbi:hypothetical protein VSDG_09369 [Cytospora chrysosperma]|uniref:FAS1 domain-containing protein n=1 Tax=Cytospora chrysosperma TaxID=252740 RepID=A0A423VAX4_CYTCH|nr:hypothetical protein VSDG_09369 [Valsa sordida]
MLQVHVLSLLASLAAAQSGLLNGLDQALSARQDVSTFYGLLSRYPQVLLDLPIYTGVTFIAPNNDAFEKDKKWDPDDEAVVTDTLRYHVLQGIVSTKAIEVGIPVFIPTLLEDSGSTNITGGQRVIINNQGNDEVVFTSGADSRSTVVEGEISFSDGLIHVVDTVMAPPSRLEPVCRVYYPNLRAFLAALYQTSLIDQFAGTRDVTIFAPWDAAFQLTAGALSALQPSELRDVLAYHIVLGRVLYSADLDNATSWPTLCRPDGATDPVDIRVTFAGNNRYVDSSQILHADILVANGVVHMIENVLNPALPDVLPNPSRYTQAPVFSLTGPTATGNKVPVPFTEALPSMAEPPEPTDTPGVTTTMTMTTHVAGAEAEDQVRAEDVKGAVPAAEQEVVDDLLAHDVDEALGRDGVVALQRVMQVLADLLRVGPVDAQTAYGLKADNGAGALLLLDGQAAERLLEALGLTPLQLGAEQVVVRHGLALPLDVEEESGVIHGLTVGGLQFLEQDVVEQLAQHLFLGEYVLEEL